MDAFGRFQSATTSFEAELDSLNNAINSKVDNPSTVPIVATSFIKSGGTNFQYLMADGSVTTSSGASGNSSNIYLYNSSTNTAAPPGSGQIRYNNVNQSSATTIFISPLTRDNINILEYLNLINDLSIIYIQDQNSSLNFIKYKVTADPIIDVNYIAVSVLTVSSGGIGTTSFGNGQNIFMSIFTNNTLVDSRLTTLEDKTRNQTATASNTNFSGSISSNQKIAINNMRLTNAIVSNFITTTTDMASLTGAGNTIYGSSSGTAITSGSSNTAFGYRALQKNTTGNWNICIGQDSMTDCLTGSCNISIGANLISNSSGSNNIGIGQQTLNSCITGSNNVGIGLNSLNLHTGSNNTALGSNSGNSSIQTTNSTALGYNSVCDGNNQVVLGNTSVTEVKSSGVFNGSGFKTPTGTANDILLANGSINSTALSNISTNTSNITTLQTKTQNQSATSENTNFVGKINGNYFKNNNAIGTVIISDLDNSNCSGIGCVSIGRDNLKNNTGSSNISVGSNSLENNVNGMNNTAVGGCVLQSTNSSFNTSVGFGSLNLLESGVNNTAIGYHAGYGITNLNNTTSLGNYAVATASNQIMLGNGAVSEVKSSGIFTSNIGFKTSLGTSNDILLANGTLNSSLLEIINWRYQSWGYVGATPTIYATDCVAFMTHIGGTISVGTIIVGSSKGLKYRVQSNPATTSNGAVAGWLGNTSSPSLYIKSGYKIVIGFCLNDTSTNASTRSMLGLFQSTTAPVLNNTATIASLTTQSIGIIQEVGENVWSFYTRGSTGSTKIATSISCQTPSNNWLQLEILNLVNSNDIIMTLKDLDAGTFATQNFTCNTVNSISNANQNYIQIQRNMASASGVAGSALIQTASVRIWSSA